MLKIILKNNILNIKNLFFCSLFFYLIISINITPFNLLSEYKVTQANLFLTLLKILIGISPMIVFTFSIIYLFLNRSKLVLTQRVFIFLLYIFYNLIQLVPIFLYGEVNSINSIYWVIAACSLPIFIMCAEIIDIRYKEYFFYIAMAFFCSIGIFFLMLVMYSTFLSEIVHFSFYGHESLDPANNFFGVPIPRSSGLGRFSVLIFMASHLLIIHVKLDSKILIFSIYLLIIFTLFSIFHLQSRVLIGFVLIYYLFNLFPFNKGKLLERFVKISLIFLLAFVIHLSFPLISGKIKFNLLNIEINAGKIHPALKFFFIDEILQGEIDVINERRNQLLKEDLDSERKFLEREKANILLLNEAIKFEAEKKLILKEKSIKEHSKKKFKDTEIEIRLFKEKQDFIEELQIQLMENNNQVFEIERKLRVTNFDEPAIKIAKQNIEHYFKTNVQLNDLNDEEISEIFTKKLLSSKEIKKKIGKSYVKDIGMGRLNENLDNSGRISLLKKGYKNLNENIFIGRGPMSDRIYLGENLSNLLLYTLFSGGAFSLLSMIIILILVFLKCFKETFIIQEMKNKDNLLKKFSLYCLGFLLVRSLGENSFAIFGVDQVIFILSISIIFSDKKFFFFKR